MSMVEVKVPDIGDVDEVEVIELMVKVGDTVKVDQSLLTVESDKASMEIPSSHAGVVKALTVKLGDKVKQGSSLLMLSVEQESDSASSTASQTAQTAQTAQTVSNTVPASRAPSVLEGVGKPHASPSVRKFARELGVNLSQVSGTGRKARITHEDVRQYVKEAINTRSMQPGGSLELLPWPALDFSKFGTTELIPLSRIKKISGPNLHRNWVMIPHVTQFDEADVTELETFRQQVNAQTSKSPAPLKMTMLAFVIKASVAALKKFPTLNASLDAGGENLILKHYFNVGFAADTPNGLVVPVIKEVDKKGMTQIVQEMTDLSAQAREGKLKPTDMQGATFTISSLGGIGGTAFTPIINAPEVAILGLSKSSFKPVWDGKQFVPRLMLPLSLSYDHRVVDGAMGARFTRYLADLLEDMRKMLL